MCKQCRKKLFSGINTSRNRKLQIKETKLKNTFYNIDKTIKNFKKDRISTKPI